MWGKTASTQDLCPAVLRPLQHPWTALSCTSSTASCCTVLKGQLWKQRQTSIAVLPCPGRRVYKEQIFPCPAATMQWQCYSQEASKSVQYMGLVPENREKQSKNRLNNNLSISASGAERQGGRGHAKMEMNISKLVHQNGLWCFSQYLLFDPIIPGGKFFSKLELLDQVHLQFAHKRHWKPPTSNPSTNTVTTHWPKA